MHELFARLDALADDGDFDAVEDAAAGALQAEAVDAADAMDLWRYIAWARFERGDLDGAIEAAGLAEDPLCEAKARFHKWDFAGARRALADCEDAVVAEDAADAAWYRGLLEEFEDGDPEPHYRRAFRLAPALYPPPVRLRDDEIDRVLADALAGMPEPVSAALEDAVITVVALPSPHADVDPLTLGLYVGLDHMQRSVLDGPSLPASIEVYRGNIERLAVDRAEVVEELRVTLLHEIAHHLGFDEDGVEHLGLG